MKIGYRKLDLSTDLHQIKNLKLKELDCLEIKALLGTTPRNALLTSIHNSGENVWVVELDDRIEAVFGIGRGMAKGSGQPWYLSTERHLEFPRVKFLRTSKKIINEMLQVYPKLSNYVLAARSETIAWLQWLGFDINSQYCYYFSDPNVPFLEFYMMSGGGDN